MAYATQYATAETVTTVFNSHGLPIQVGGYTELIEYDPYGRPIKTTMGPAGSQGGLVNQTVYSATDNRLARQVATTRAGQVLQDDTYTYDAPGNPTQILNRADKVLGTVDGTLGRVDGTLGSVDGTLTTVDVTLAEVSTTLTEVKSLLAELDSKLAPLDQVPAIVEQLGAVHSAVMKVP